MPHDTAFPGRAHGAEAVRLDTAWRREGSIGCVRGKSRAAAGEAMGRIGAKRAKRLRRKTEHPYLAGGFSSLVCRKCIALPLAMQICHTNATNIGNVKFPLANFGALHYHEVCLLQILQKIWICPQTSVLRAFFCLQSCISVISGCAQSKFCPFGTVFLLHRDILKSRRSHRRKDPA